MSKHRRVARDLTRDALRRIEEARTSYLKSEHRVASARERLVRAEAKLVRRAARLAAAEDMLMAAALETSTPAETGRTDAVVEVDNAVPTLEVSNGLFTVLTPLNVELEQSASVDRTPAVALADPTPTVAMAEVPVVANGTAPRPKASHGRRGAAKAIAQAHDEDGTTDGSVSGETKPRGDKTPSSDDAS